jgi:hypothetical protein
MTRVQILAAAAVVLSVIMVAKGASFLHANSDTRQPSNVMAAPTESDFDTPAGKKGDRLPMLELPAVSTPSKLAPAPDPPQEIQAATEDDLRQAEEEHHRKRDICPRGRSYFTIDHHQYWRCKR